MGRSHKNLIMDTRSCEVEFAGGTIAEITVIIIAESMYAKYISDGNEYLLLHVLFDYQKADKVICQSDHQITVWDRQVQTARFAVAEEINHEPAFNWWVKHVLKKRNRIIASIRKQQTRYLKRSYMVGIELPKTVEEAYAMDA